MDRALDNYSVGREREVTADEIENLNLGSISADSKRFICYVCGETVRFQQRGKNRKEYFAHLQSKDNTKFCEERTDSNGSYTVYERLGLPLYIKKTLNNIYKLCIGFYNIDEKTLNHAQTENMFVIVKSELGNTQETVKFLINNINFSANTTNIKTLDFIAERYSVRYSSQCAEKLIGKHWTNFAEGILNGRALFTFDDSGGRKIRINEEVTTGIDYFLLIGYSNNAPEINGLDCQLYGEVEFKFSKCKLYKIQFTKVDRRLSDFCRQNLKVSLVNMKANLIPIWPPCSKKDNMISFWGSAINAHFAVISDNEQPQVFTHTGNFTSLINISKINDSIATVKVAIGNTVMPLTIDRRFNSDILLISNKIDKVKYYKNRGDFLALDESKYQTYDKIPTQKSLRVVSDSKSTVIHKKSTNFQSSFKIRNRSGIIVTDISFGDEISVLSGAELLNKVIFKRQLLNKEDIIIEDSNLAYRLSKMGGPYVTTVYWIKEIMKELYNMPKSFAILKGYLNHNLMPQQAIEIFREILVKKKVGIKDGR